METKSNQTAHHPAGATNHAALLRRCGMQQVMVGAVAFVIGLMITVVTFQHPVGGVFVVPTGVMVVGAISVVRGLVTVARSMKLS